MRLGEEETTECLRDDYPHGSHLVQHLCKQRHGIGKAPAQSIRRP
jgi:hypothetical protein